MILHFSFNILGSTGNIVKIQIPLSLFISSGDPVSISCRTSESVLHSDEKTYLNWVVHKMGQAPRGIIYQVSNWYSGILDSFSGSGSGQTSHSKSAGWKLRMLEFITDARHKIS